MKKSVGVFVFLFLVVFVFGVSFVSAGVFSDVWNKMTGKAVYNSSTLNLSDEEKVMFDMMNLDYSLARKYKKYGDIVLINYSYYDTVPRCTVYFYLANVRGDLNPIGEKCWTDFGDGKGNSIHWGVIRGRGTEFARWSRHINTNSIIINKNASGSILSVEYGTFVPKEYVNVVVVGPNFYFSDHVIVMALLNGAIAVRENKGISKEVSKSVREAQRIDELAQGNCRKSSHVLLENFIENVTEDGRRVFEFDLVSILGSNPAIMKYGIYGVEGVNRYHIVSGLVESVSRESTEGDRYTIEDIKECR